MKKLFTAFTLTLSLLAGKGPEAFEQIQVESLAEGACWLQPYENGVQLVSFNEKRSFTLEAFEIERLFEQELKINRDDILSLKTFVHCSAMGLAIVFNFNTEAGSRCLWTSVTSEGLERRDFGFNGPGQTGFCDGARMGELIILTKGGAAQSPLEAALAQITGPQVQANVQQFATDVYKVTIPSSFYGQETAVREKLLAHPALLELVRAVEFAPYYHPIGEVRELSLFSF